MESLSHIDNYKPSSVIKIDMEEVQLLNEK